MESDSYVGLRGRFYYVDSDSLGSYHVNSDSAADLT